MRHAEVALDLGSLRGAGSLTYRVPDDMPIRPGDLVLVPLQQRLLPGVVVGVVGEAPSFETKPVEEKLAEDAFVGPLQLMLARWMSAHYRASLYACLTLFLPPGLTQRLTKAAQAGHLKAPTLPPTSGTPPTFPPPQSGPPLTLPQQAATRRIVRAIEQHRHQAFLLHGVTGSGKTHVYLEAVAQTLARGRQAIVLVPEIGLTPATERRFAERFGERIAVLHSGLKPSEHRRSWERVRRGEADIVLGSRSALFAPVRRPGLVILDEEHEPAYRQDMSPRYHAREVALWWGQIARAPVVLGSATPDVESYYRAERGRYTLLTLATRYRHAPSGTQAAASPMRPNDDRDSSPATRSGEGTASSASVATSSVLTVALSAVQAMPRSTDGETGSPGESTPSYDTSLPPVAIVDMRSELRAGHTSIFSRALTVALASVLGHGEQALLFLNRRGSATCVSCRDCGYVAGCRRCDIPLVYHRAGESLICHRCNRRQPLPERCPGCGGTRIRYFGLGTQRVEQELRNTFPAARVIRWDRDATAKRGAYEELWRSFAAGEADVLIGTQMIAKALDFPRVTLVGVVLADVGLFLPDFRAGERIFQLLTQMAGRGGRGTLAGRAIVQTYVPEHYAIAAAAQHDYHRFYEQEIAFRRAHGYPPLGRLVRLVYSARKEERCLRETMRVRGRLDEEIAHQAISDIQILGPAPCFMRRMRGLDRWQIVLRGDRFARLLDRLDLAHGWSIDVDPVSLL
ncbi:MAG: primosomal protein N' [Chloroflexi bacterium]|nr:primosomal protein N' [Chloroflexota bacterium]